MSSPILRIDYAQHAWSAIGHGAPFLRLAGDHGAAAGGDRRSEAGTAIDYL
jgi:hypothetical protein